MNPEAIPAAAAARLACQEIDHGYDPGALMQALRPLGQAVWLDSGDGGHGGRYDLLTAGPREWLDGSAGRWRLRRDDGPVESVSGDPFVLLAERLQARALPATGLPFAGGAIGQFSYELGYACNALAVPFQPPPAGGLPELAVGLYDWAVVRDLRQQRSWLIRHHDARMTAAGLQALLQAAPAAGGFRLGAVEEDCDRAGYLSRFEQVQAYLQAGDCYQVNLSRGYRAGFEGDPLTFYRALRRRSPAPYGAFLETPDGVVLSVSPERFLRLQAGRVETRPIKGTRPRDPDPSRDQAQRLDLLASPKDRAENVMIVDLLRNDLGRVCAPGSVAVPELFQLESHPTVHHLVSTVTGRLRPGVPAAALLRACFPGGSITGAPKRRAMEIIAELEQVRRGVYCGSVACLGFDGTLDCSIAIRTAMLQSGEMHYRAGGGLVVDSVGDDEFLETEHKARAFLEVARAGY